MILVFFTLCSGIKAQMDSEDNYCLRSNYFTKTLESVKYIKKYNVEKGDTSMRVIKVNKGLYKTMILPNNTERIYTYDNKNRLVKVESVIVEKNNKINEVCSCNYDDKGRLNSIVIEEKTEGESDKIYRDDIIYLNGVDSIKYVGEFYSMIISNQKKEGYDLKTIYDTLGNVKLIEKYINGNKIYSRNFDKGDETSGIYYLYDEKGLLKTKVNEGFDLNEFMTIIEYTNYSYDDGNKLIEEKQFTGNSELYSIRTISYNDKGLINRDVKKYIKDQELIITFFEYEYW